MLYEKIFKKLNEHEIKYLAIGGIATNLYGFSRLTMDLDIMVSPDHENFSKLFIAMTELGFEQVTPVMIEQMSFVDGHVKVAGWQGIIIVFKNSRDEDERIDVFLRNPIDFIKAYQHHEVRKINDTQVHIVAFDDLIKLKELSGRDKDLRDVGYLKMIKEMLENKNEEN
ncbi:hypothetical protein COT42_02675 [Candidatus Saganbacteria bacterium CG08_land_8_20_14_0_20_45_16]|uniref:Nucleotidyltransferase n=1 Tax=Candidatus Saganbacteria bacterium CG08_land_8_20_14_0_20_45_16 TaxID=2014293 RepID=A0A2H0Y1Z4_UNCSA|nr:MAG: hypothetical protein COT42_02675 [Candidatus Saganbacteria bacterium CG08_land_8_20_14_0_20_45_16]